MRRIYKYDGITKDEKQRSLSAMLKAVSLSNGPSAMLRAASLSSGRWTFYEAVRLEKRNKTISQSNCSGLFSQCILKLLGQIFQDRVKLPAHFDYALSHAEGDLNPCQINTHIFSENLSESRFSSSLDV